jgi:hypothetical protein
MPRTDLAKAAALLDIGRAGPIFLDAESSAPALCPLCVQREVAVAIAGC